MKHGDPFHPDPEGKTRIFLSVVTNRFENLRMNHPAAQNLQPPRAGTDPASISAAHDTPHVHFSAGLGEREEAWPEPDRDLAAEELMDKLYKPLRSLNATPSSTMNPST